MRIGVDARLADYTVGGIARYTVQLARAMERVGSDHELIALRSRRPKVDAPRVAANETIALHTPPHNRFERFALPLELRNARLDVLHSPDFIAPPGPWRKVITVHDLAYLRMPWLLTKDSRRYYNGIRRAVAWADAVIAVSDATARDVPRLVAEQLVVADDLPGPWANPDVVYDFAHRMPTRTELVDHIRGARMLGAVGPP